MLNDDLPLEPIVYTAEQLRHIVRTPVGKCPIKFSYFWDLPTRPPDTVIGAWFWTVRDYGLRRGEFYTSEAMVYWLQNELDVDDDNYRDIAQTIYNYAKTIQDP